ncbi:Mss4-like protein [Microdochium trichocladiopsis]|uniref:Mss4-like protein n=1 Tax=Microdochium trichocladiopsis TaxID=1682393 RepID=A0A9P9BML2_9PEZI|nr:Mss4-like protein [Microdochium trichocladiopsis]KAH7026383.1 Mss4-like protein [Microdochium trichocladiopsis]
MAECSSNSRSLAASSTLDHHSGSNDRWQDEPPYKLTVQKAADAGADTTGRREKFEKKLEAQCHCGRVRYWISRDKPLVAKFCHCHGCQKLHGAPFQWAAIFHKSDILFEHGAQGIEFYNSGNRNAAHDLPCKLSCQYCRAPIMDEGRRMVLLFPTLIDFARVPADAGDGLGPSVQHPGKQERSEEDAKRLKDGFYPDCHIFYSQRLVDIPDSKPKWKGLDGADGILCDNMP